MNSPRPTAAERGWCEAPDEWLRSRGTVTVATPSPDPSGLLCNQEPKAMKKTMLFPALLAIACMSQPPAAPPADAPRVAIDIQYVGVPSMNVYANPRETASVITTYGYTESVSILARQGNWVEVRTVQGSGWAHAADLIGAREVQPLLATPAPRFLTPPVGIPDPRARGEIIIEAKVNTDGDVVATTIVKN